MDFTKYEFVYGAEVHFAGVEKFPGGLMKEMDKKGRAPFDAMCWVLAAMAEHAELLRRDLGHDKREVPSADYFKLHMKLKDIMPAKQIILNCIAKGLRGETDEDEEVDEVLAEIEKKADGD